MIYSSINESPSDTAAGNVNGWSGHSEVDTSRGQLSSIYETTQNDCMTGMHVSSIEHSSTTVHSHSHSHCEWTASTVDDDQAGTRMNYRACDQKNGRRDMLVG